jgi:hypothetical protein
MIKPMLVFTALFLFGFLATHVAFLVFDPDFYAFPAVTQCPLCEETVWEWQPHEYREYKVHVTGADTSGSIRISVAMYGICHSNCNGKPEVTVNFDTGEIK